MCLQFDQSRLTPGTVTDSQTIWWFMYRNEILKQRLKAYSITRLIYLKANKGCRLSGEKELSWYHILEQKDGSVFPVGAVPGSHGELVCLCATWQHILCFDTSCCYLIFLPQCYRWKAFTGISLVEYDLFHHWSGGILFGVKFIVHFSRRNYKKLLFLKTSAAVVHLRNDSGLQTS